MERDDREMHEVTRGWRQALRDWLRSTDAHIPVWQAFAAFILLVTLAVFSINAFAPGGIGDLIGGSDGNEAGSSTDPTPAADDTTVTTEAPTTEEPAAEEPAAEEPVAEPTAAPAHFVGTIVSDNGWLTITVTADGQATGMLTVSQSVQGDASVSSGSFAGTIGADDVITCNGTFTGTTYASNGQSWPHKGTVSVTAVPTHPDRTSWQIDFTANPGSSASFPAHTR